FKLQLAPLNVHLVPIGFHVLQGNEEFAALVFAVDVAERRGDHRYDQQGQQQTRRLHACRSAIRNTALRARGLAPVSAASARIALPISRSRPGFGPPVTGRSSGISSPRLSRRRKRFTIRSSSE